MKLYKPVFFVALIALVLFGWGCDFKTPTEKNIVGVWAISPSAKEKLTHFDPSGAMFFNGDHTFTAQNLPSEMFGGLLKDESTISGSGEWALDKAKLRLHFKAVNKEQNASVGTVLEVQEKTPPILFFYLGDPDEGRVVAFQKM